LHGHLAAQRGRAKRDRHHDFDALALARAGGALRTALPRGAAEHRGEQIAQTAQPADVEVLHARTRSRTGTSARGIARPAASLLPLAAEPAERPQAAHLVVLLSLLGIAQDV